MSTKVTLRPSVPVPENEPLPVPPAVHDSDPALAVAPPRPGGSLTVQLAFAGHSMPLPVDDPDLPDEDAA